METTESILRRNTQVKEALRLWMIERRAENLEVYDAILNTCNAVSATTYLLTLDGVTARGIVLGQVRHLETVRDVLCTLHGVTAR